ncbi:MAG: hypothetical protein H0V81_17025 [Solirubrobacterales bacterium]|nr:hypothetical protein [Solirubrobacterales bacterium]
MAKQRQVRIEQKSALAQMQALESRSNEELERETRMKSAAMAILGARAAERYDAKASREYFRRAVAAARPQERMQLRRMADASLALAERRPDDLKTAVERLGQEAPSSRQLFLLRVMGLLAPAQGASRLAKVRAFAIIIAIVLVLLLVGFGLAKLIALPFGGAGTFASVLLGLLVIIVLLAVLTFVGRRRQAKALAARSAAGATPPGGTTAAVKAGSGKAKKPAKK